MVFLSKIRDFAARRALAYKLEAEMSSLSDAELNDLNLSYAQVVELSHMQAQAA